MPSIEENLGWIAEAKRTILETEQDLLPLPGYVKMQEIIKKAEATIEQCMKDIKARWTPDHEPVEHAGQRIHNAEQRNRGYGVRDPDEAREALARHGLDEYIHELIVSERKEKLVPIAEAEKLLPGELHPTLAKALDIRKPTKMEIEPCDGGG